MLVPLCTRSVTQSGANTTVLTQDTLCFIAGDFSYGNAFVL